MNITGNPLIDIPLSHRGVTDISQIDYKLSKILPIHSLNFVEDVAKAIIKAIDDKKRILIIADYDCDGVTSCTVMIRMLKSLNANLGWLIPDRSIHGYGLTPELVDFAIEGWVNGSTEIQSQIEEQIKNNILAYAEDVISKQNNSFKFQTTEQILATSTHYFKTVKPEVIITVDNGIASVAGVDRANELGLQVIVTDHHLAGEKLPNALAIVNPNHPQSTFQSKALCGVGVAWYVCAAITQLLKSTNRPTPFPIKDLLPYVAFGTVADVVSLDFNNRTLVKIGLDQFKANTNAHVGLSSILDVSKVAVKRLTTSAIGFQIAPRLNAAGRISNMGIGLLNLITDDPAIAQITAAQLQYLNEERKSLTANIENEVLESITEQIDFGGGRTNPTDNDLVLVAYPKENEWHEGVIGIVAGRLKERYNRPSIVLTYIEENDTYKGSCRSIPKLNMKDLLDEVSKRDPNIFVKFGGHAMAAGLTLYADKVERFQQLVNEIAATMISPSDFEKIVQIDYEPKSRDLTVANVEAMQNAIWGQNFPEPIFANDFEVVQVRRIGADEKHLKLTLKLGQSLFDAIKFFCDWDLSIGEVVRLIYSPSINEWNDRISVNLMIADRID